MMGGITSFAAGLLTVFTPCVLPLLPMILTGAVGEYSRYKTARILLSFGVVTFAATLLLKVSSIATQVPPYVLTLFSGSLVVWYGLTLLFPNAWSRFVAGFNSHSLQLLARGTKSTSSFSDIIIGGALGLVFASCSPTYFLLLATVFPVSVALGALFTLLYILGTLCAFALVFYCGQKLSFLYSSGKARRGVEIGIGMVAVFVGSAIVLNQHTFLASFVPAFAPVTRVEQIVAQKLVSATSDQKKGIPSDPNMCADGVCIPDGVKTTLPTKAVPAVQAIDKDKVYARAPEIVAPDGFLNTGGKEISFSEFQGKKVVLVSIWTYSCINCQRTLPYLNQWYDAYKDKGLEIISIHTPEFAYEKIPENVQKAIEERAILYPVVLDNEYKTWRAFGNNYWPRKYLIDIDGYIVHDHIGEGAYEETEMAIQAALSERMIRHTL